MRNRDLLFDELKACFARREFVATALASGYAAAVQPVAAQTQINTDSNGLVAGEVSIPVRDGLMPAYRAMPAGGGKLPTVLVVQEIFGVHEHIKDIARRLAKAGYLAVAPELYFRQGDVSRLRASTRFARSSPAFPTRRSFRTSMPRPNGPQATEATPTSSRSRAFAGAGASCGSTRLTIRTSGRASRGTGSVEGAGTQLQPKQPDRRRARADRRRCWGLYGGADAGIPNDGVERMRAALKAAGKPCEIHTYPDAPHAFHADYRPRYRPEAALDGWLRLLAWFRKSGVA